MSVKSVWDRIPGWGKVAGGLTAMLTFLALIISGGARGYSHLTNDPELEARVAVVEARHSSDEKSRDEKFKQDRIDRLERENQRIRTKLANPDIEAWEKEQLTLDRDENLEKIKCIRDDKC